MFCNKCGNKIEDGELFCGACGSPRKGEAVKTQPAATALPTPVQGSRRQAVIALTIAAAAVLLALAIFVVVPSMRYSKANRLFYEQQYAEAFATLQKLSSGYKDVSSLYPYYGAHASLAGGEYEAAALGFAGCGNFRDSAQMVLETRYQQAVSLLTPEGSVQARALFLELGDYKDSADRWIDCDYFDAVAMLNDKKYSDARAAFRKLGDFSDSAQMLLECDYQEAFDWLNDKKYDEARTVFLKLDNYKDSPDMLTECDYREAGDLLSNGSYKEAYNMLTALGDYKDSAELAEQSKEVAYDQAVLMRSDDFFVSAANIFSWLGDYKDSREQLDALAPYWYRANSYRIASMGSTVYALKSDGNVIRADYRSPERFAAVWSDITAISASSEYLFYARGHLVGLKSDGSVVATGDNTYGQCDVGGWRNIVQIATAGNVTLGLKEDGSVLTTEGHLIADLRSEVSSWRGITAIAGTTSGGHPVMVGLKEDGSIVISTQYGFDLSEWRDIAAIWAADGQVYGVKEDGSTLWSAEEYAGAIPSSEGGFRAAAPFARLFGDNSINFDSGVVIYVLDDGSKVTLPIESTIREIMMAELGLEPGSEASGICELIAVSELAVLRADGAVIFLGEHSDSGTVAPEEWTLD